MPETTAGTRYARVREILDAAAAGSTADYGVGEPFWRLPHARLLEVKVHGVRMIAPAQEKGSCGCSGPSACSRSAASGLVQGLRGQAPFDGTRFPPLPWGGKPVAADDVDFIARWIDDGCPETGGEVASLPLYGELASAGLQAVPAGVRVEGVVEAWEADVVSHGDYAWRRGEVRQRVNLDCMPAVEVQRLRDAFRALYDLNKWPEDRRSYNNLALIHQNHCQHGWERFLPWHRIYLYEFEQALQDLSPGVSLTYWDWTMAQYRPECPEKGWIIPRSLQAFLTGESLAYLAAAEPPLPEEAVRTLEKEMVRPGKSYPSQRKFFTAVGEMIGAEYTKGDHRKRFIDALLAANALWYPLRYPAEYAINGKPGTITQVIHYHYPSADDIAQILSLRTFRDFGGGSLYNDSFGFLDQNPHNTMHIWTGGQNPDHVNPPTLEGDLGGNRNRGVRVAGRRFHSREDLYSQPESGDMFSNLTASYDPVFWPIHVNVDRLWWEWQEAHPHGDPADLDAVLTPWSYTIRDTLDIARFGYEYVRSAFLIPVGLETPVGRFVSRPVEVPEPARGFKQAEVRLLRVPQLPRSCFIRVFLNLPDASAATPIDHPNYAGYLAVFGHGECIGGPGHCAIPDGRGRPFDLRPRSHNTPRNHRVNVTKTARRLLDEGADSLRITLVTIGVDYCEENELLRMEGVSLNLLD
jgi:tyrosinase